MKTSFVRSLILLVLVALIASAVFAETPKVLPYITSLAADGVAGVGSGGAAGQLWTAPYAVAVDANNNIYFAGSVPATNAQVFKIDYKTGVVTAFAGGTVKATSPASTCATPDTNTGVIPAPWTSDNVGDGCPALQTNFNGIRGLYVANGYLYISDSSASAIKKIYLDPTTPAPGRLYVNEMEPVVGGVGSTWNGDGLRAVATIKSPYGIAVDKTNGNVYWGDGGSSGYAVRMYDVATDSVLTVTKPGTATVAPTAGCQKAPSLSLATASLAQVTNPYGMDFDADGNLYFGDKGCYSVRKLTRNSATNKVDSGSAFSTLIGTGATGTGSGSWYNTTGTPAYMAAIRSVTSAGGDNLYIMDTKNVWYYDATTGWVHQFYGSSYSTSPGCTANSTAPYMGCPAANVQFAGSSGGCIAATNSFGDLFIADYGNNIIQKVKTGLDFVGTPNVTTTAPSVANSSIMVHGSGVTGLAGTGPFSTGTAVCSTYNAGDLEAECIVPATYTPSNNGIETGTFTSTGNTAGTYATQGLGAGVVATLSLNITASSASMNFGDSVPSLTYTTDRDPISPALTTAPNCTTTATSSSDAGTYPITCSGAADARFSPITYTAGTLTVNPMASGLVTINKSSLNYSAPVGTGSSSQMVTLFNNSTFAITVAPSVTGDYVLSGNSCTGSVAPGGTQCNVWVRFTPTVAGTRTGTLTINYSGQPAPLTVSLSGNGVTQLTLSTNSMTFAPVVVGLGSSSQMVNIYNQTSSTVNAVTPSITGNFIVSGNTCTTALAPGTACNIWVRFTPQSVASLSGTLTISADGIPAGTVALSGTGTGSVTLNKTSMVFGTITVGQGSSSQMVTLFNNSGVGITVAPSIAGNDFIVSGNSCTGTVAAGGTQCNIWVRFTPQSANPSLTGTLTINANGSPIGTVALSGSGL